MEVIENKIFWDELCGTHAFKMLGLTKMDQDSIVKFDKWYMDFYPYLYKHLKCDQNTHKRVLEIGLGFGTVGEKLFLSSNSYVGMDYAQNPVDMMNQRISWKDKTSSAIAIQGDARNMPFMDNEFDIVVSIGCLHHTGDTQKSIDEVYRVLKPGGKCLIMLYNKSSYRIYVSRWLHKVALLLNRTKHKDFDIYLKSLYDADTNGDAAPIIDFYSPSDLRIMFSKFNNLEFNLENNNIKLIRKYLLNNFSKLYGLDNYIIASK